jgi:hypothetical protein
VFKYQFSTLHAKTAQFLAEFDPVDC